MHVGECNSFKNKVPLSTISISLVLAPFIKCFFIFLSFFFSEPSRCLSFSLHTSLWHFIDANYEVHCGNFGGQCCGQVIRIKFLNNIMTSNIIKLWCTDKRQHACPSSQHQVRLPTLRAPQLCSGPKLYHHHFSHLLHTRYLFSESFLKVSQGLIYLLFSPGHHTLTSCQCVSMDLDSESIFVGFHWNSMGNQFKFCELSLDHLHMTFWALLTHQAHFVLQYFCSLICIDSWVFLSPAIYRAGKAAWACWYSFSCSYRKQGGNGMCPKGWKVLETMDGSTQKAAGACRRAQLRKCLEQRSLQTHHSPWQAYPAWLPRLPP